ncbi:MAG: hypothetical protein JJU29_15350 [Verrucomicrobia bacterium]|nr:hypothetical protein [Verrucomicrobiota bacterium]
MKIPNIQLSLLAKHPTFSAFKLSELLNVKPEVQWDVGSFKKNKVGEKISDVNRESYICKKLIHSNKYYPSELLDWVVGILRKDASGIDEILNTGGEVALSMGLFPNDSITGDSFMPDLLKNIGELGVKLMLAVYFEKIGAKEEMELGSDVDCGPHNTDFREKGSEKGSGRTF